MTIAPRFCRTLVVIAVASMLLAGLPCAGAQADHALLTHVIELLADSDSRYKIAGERTPEITVKAGEQVLLRGTARRGKSWNRDGSIHRFSLLRAKDRTKLERLELLVKPGNHEFR